MADDLDDFFNDIEEAEAEAVKETEKETKSDHADDDNDGSDHELPPSKKVKTNGTTIEATAPTMIRPKGLVVAAASSAVIRKPPREDEEDDDPSSRRTASHSFTNKQQASFLTGTSMGLAPPPPPPPPPPMTMMMQQPMTGIMATTTTTVNPASTPNNSNLNANTNTKNSTKPIKRMAAGKVWVDPTLEEWPDNDFRIFCGNLDRSTTDAQLHDHFSKYPSLAKAKVVKDSGGTSKGYGFVSFLQPLDCAKAIREMDQTWLGSRPIRVKRSDWKDRNLNRVLKKKKKESKVQKRFGL